MLRYDNIFLLCYTNCLQFVKPCVVPKPLCLLILFPVKMRYFQYPQLFPLLINNVSFVTLPSLNLKRTIMFVVMVISFRYVCHLKITATLTDVSLCFFLSCKANARV
jgi:hypothetical protein